MTGGIFLLLAPSSRVGQMSRQKIIVTLFLVYLTWFHFIPMVGQISRLILWMEFRLL
jgi:hypothetical protein